jgi:ketosteroid isomerase-like protein
MRALARRFFDAIEAGDVDGLRACYAPHAEIWHNTDGRVSTREENVRTLRDFIARVPQRRYEKRRVHVFEGGFVQQHDLHCILSDHHHEIVLPACLVCRVEQDVIVRLDEYFDSARLAEFRRDAGQ